MAPTKPLLVGLMPNRSNGGPPLTGRIGLRLQRWIGLPPYLDGQDILTRFDTINVNRLHAESVDHFEALETAMCVLRHDPNRPIVLCGRVVAEVFDLAALPFWTWTGSRIAIIPHPSGLNRVYNDKQACRSSAKILIEAMQMAEKGR